MLTSTRRRLAVASLGLLLPLTASCGFDYQTDQVYQPAIGTDERDGTIDVLNAVIVSGTEGEGTFVATLVNQDLEKDSRLTSVTGPQGVQVELVKPVDVAAQQAVNLAGEGAVSVSGDDVTSGAYIRLKLEFDNGQTTSVNTQVVDRDGQFADVESAAPSPTATPSGSPSSSPSESASASPSGSASPSATPSP